MIVRFPNHTNFSIPEEKIINSVPPKDKMVSSLFPGNKETYIYYTEELYYKEYQRSLFAINIKRRGWDNLRLYEILANGCLPYFPDIENCPSNVMPMVRKDLLELSNDLYHRIHKKQINDLTNKEKEEYLNLVNRLLEHTRTTLTCRNVSKSMLKMTKILNHVEVNKILFLSGNTDVDYLRCCLLIGLKQLMGTNCHDYPKIPHLYKDFKGNLYSCHGQGYTITKNLEPLLHNDELDKTIIQDIKLKKYDLIIYGSMHKDLPFYDLVLNHYEPNKIVMICGEDSHQCPHTFYIRKEHIIFTRGEFL